MGRREARGVEQRIHLDTLVRLQKYGGTRSTVTGNFTEEVVADETAWAAVSKGRTELDVGAENTTLVFAASVTIRWHPSFVTLTGGPIRLFNPADDAEEISITNVELIGRRRFIKLEYNA